MQRQAQSNTRAFLQLLQSLSPAVTSQSSWQDVQQRLASEPVFQAVPAPQQLQIFQSYQAAVRKLETAQQKRATAAFQVGPTLSSCCIPGFRVQDLRRFFRRPSNCS